MTPTGRKTSRPEPQPVKLRDVETGLHPLAEVDYSQIERRVLVLGGRGHSKTPAMLARMEAEEACIKQAFAVPAEMLGTEAQSPLTGQELQAIMETQPEFREKPARSKPPKNPFAEGSIKRYTK
ncbi:hypothetical protein FDH82_gp47 [Roseobacter phage RDJL Phi 2]|uniref:Uncharacterized protein n=1 Tax=Roseobacter phage RDJL Phi 2 TaxID=1682380 RepID=A0A0K0PVI0_9CAUD|nr:hypothetical protein FDH82_gp47 [Roseobacter phage RDJL Phi 2]AKQ75837.1 hypothetical protein RDJLphi2_gp47 [Roseobacter phage RDJL Phi 2]